jgi:hypothetical protein
LSTITKLRTLALLVVVAHWIVAVWHLFLAARLLPAPDNNVSSLAIVLITCGHLCVAIALWKLSDRLAGSVAFLFFLLALSADLYEHFLHAAPNNVFMTPTGVSTAWFDGSVVGLLALEVLACSLGILLLSRRLTPRPAT